MANVVIVSSLDSSTFDPFAHSSTLLLRHSAQIDAFGVHHLIEDPEAADIILFGEQGECGMFAECVRAHPFYRRFPDKCFIFDIPDTVCPVLPGLYSSLTRSQYRPDHTRTGFWLLVTENAFIQHRPLTGNEPYLACFLGASNSHPIRRSLFELRSDRILMEDTSKRRDILTDFETPALRAQFWSAYADSMASALFSLCPRGAGAGSVRLFESMKMGRACVIISDAWQPNDGVDWDSFSIQVAEKDISAIPGILEQHAGRAAEMGLRARSEWEKWFSEKVRFHRVVELCLDIRQNRRFSGPLRRLFDQRHILLHPRLFLRSRKILYRKHHRIFW